jgi:tRNA (guanine10-N2)-dimethyltransferase
MFIHYTVYTLTMHTKTICILGRLPAIATAELESLYGGDKIKKLSNESVLIDIDPKDINYSRLGGTVKMCKLLHIFDNNNWASIEAYLENTISEHINEQKKLTLGLSAYNVRVNPKQLLKTGLKLKKIIKKQGVSFRLVPNNESALSSAQVYHNKLTKLGSIELCFIGSENKIYMAQTVSVQDIDAYSARDQARPKRDARVGMLSPKLAQTIINLANPKSGDTVLDPFCGTGVVLQEALLMDFKVLGTDLEPRMIEFTDQNINIWLADKFPDTKNKVALKVADATSTLWNNESGFNFDTIACETYLGRPLSSLPSSIVLDQIIRDVDTILKKFLGNVARQTDPGFRLCLAVPAWKTRTEFLHLPLLDHLERLGYTRMKFTHVNDKDLIYHREGQIVGRELIILIRK